MINQGQFSYNDSYNANWDSLIQRMNKDNSLQAIQPLSPSEVKSPTLNSSFRRSVSSLYKNMNSQKGNNLQFSEQEINNKQLEYGRPQCLLSDQYINYTNPSPHSPKLYNFSVLQSQQLDQKYKQLDGRMEKTQYLNIRRFARNIMKQVGFWRLFKFSSLTLSLLSEQFVKVTCIENLTNLNNNYINYPLIQLWNAFVIINLVICLITIPLQQGFELDYLANFHIYIIIIMSFDMIVTFYKPLILGDKFIKDKWIIFNKYANSDMVFDIISVVLLFVFLQTYQMAYINIFLQLIVITINYCKIMKYMDYINDFIFIGNMQRILGQIIIIFINELLISHFIGCFWYKLGNEQPYSWINIQELNSSDFYTQYIHSLHWGICFILNKADTPLLQLQNNELIFVIFMNLFCIFNITYLILEITKLYQASQSNNKYKQILKNINIFFTQNKISFQLRQRVINYLKVYYQDQNKMEIQGKDLFFNVLSSELKEELISEQRIKQINQCQSLKKYSKQSLNQIIQTMQQLQLKPDDIIIHFIQFQKDKFKYISLMVLKLNLNILGQQQSFGEWSFFTGQQRTASAKSIGFSRIYKINAQQFYQIIQSNQKDLEQYNFIKHQLLFSKQLNYANLKCYGCNSAHHLISQCPQLFYMVDIEKLILKNNYDLQERMKFDRMNMDQRKQTNRTLPQLDKVQNVIKYFRTKHDLDEELESSISDDYLTYSQASDNILQPSLQKQDKYLNQDVDRNQKFIINEINEEDSEQIDSKYDNNNNNNNNQYTPNFQSQQQPENKQSLFQMFTPELQLSHSTYMKSSNSYLINQPSKNPVIKSITQSQALNEQYNSIVSNEDVIPSLKSLSKGIYVLRDRESSQSKRSQRKKRENSKKSLSKINEEDSNLLPMENNQIQLREYGRKFSSGLSSIQGSTIKQSFVSSPLVWSTPNNPIIYEGQPQQMVDLSGYGQQQEKDEFEVKLDYQIFFPYFNCSFVVQRYNKFLLAITDKTFKSSRYTLYQKVKEIIYKSQNI